MKEISLGMGIIPFVLNANLAVLLLASAEGKRRQLQLLMALAQHFFILAKAVGKSFVFCWKGLKPLPIGGIFYWLNPYSCVMQILMVGADAPLQLVAFLLVEAVFLFNANLADLPLASAGGKRRQVQLLMALAQHFFILAKAVGEAFVF